MARRFERSYGPAFRARQAAGDFGEADPMTAVMVATRWLFYFFTIERCFGVPMHFGMTPQQATAEFIRLLRFGLLPRPSAAGGPTQSASDGDGPARPARPARMNPSTARGDKA